MQHSSPGSSQNLIIIPDRLIFSILRSEPKNTKNVLFISIDNDPNFQYSPFCYDFGPPSLLMVHKFYTQLSHILDTRSELIHFFCSSRPENIANASFLIIVFRILRLKQTPEEAFSPFVNLSRHFRPYRDATNLPSTYDLTVFSCVSGFYKGLKLGWYNPSTFDASSWEFNEQVENGDMNWLIPNKLLAFATPYNHNILHGGWRVSTPADLINVFRRLHINHIVRLCKEFYNKTIFTDAGFRHTELRFDDGTTPPPSILERWMKLIEGPDIIALHCKAGLGRTYVFFFLLSTFSFYLS